MYEIVEAMVRRLVPSANGGWTAAGVDEFLRAYLTRSGRAAFYAAARNIYLDEPHGEAGFWTRLESLQSDSLFVWGRDYFRILAFPLAFLLLMIPLPAIVFNQIAFPLQLLASRVGAAGIQACAVPVLREGNVIVLADTSRWPRLLM